jgi:SAM-dependent methyltransferase
MTSWTSGYVADIDYTYGYYTELNPARIRLAFAANDLAFPEIGAACELGFGQGVSTNIHASASRVSWWGTDFNPAQAAFGQELGAVSGAQVFDASFAEFCSRSDLPDFDFIALHGIWTWISDQNRQVIVDFVRRKLKVGGVLYISYNTLPGWSTPAPLRHIMTEHKDKMGASGSGIVNQVEGALAFTERLLETNPMWSRSNPSIAERFTNIKPQNRNYLAHEYFNRDWHPMYFADMARYLEPAKLSFACSANFNDYLDAINLTDEHQALLNEMTDPHYRQTIRDFMVNQQFRKDYWVKGARKLNAVEKTEALRSQGVVLDKPRADVTLKAAGSLGEVSMADTVYNPILDFLGDHTPKTIGQIEAGLKELNLAQIQQAILLLVGQGHVSPTQEAKAIEACKARAKTLNQLLLSKARGSNDIGYLADPVTGGSLSVNRFQQLFLLAYQQGQKKVEQMAQSAWNVLNSQGQRLLKEGKTLETAEENLAELTAQATEFQAKLLPILKAHQIS